MSSESDVVIKCYVRRSTAQAQEAKHEEESPS